MNGKETLLMATRVGRPEHTPEAEPVLCELRGTHVVLTLDDGEQIAFDAGELRTAITETTPVRRAA